MTQKICITIPDHVFQKMEDYLITYPENRNRSAYVSKILDKHIPRIMID